MQARAYACVCREENYIGTSLRFVAASNHEGNLVQKGRVTGEWVLFPEENVAIP
jgi:hypothetical protein